MRVLWKDFDISKIILLIVTFSLSVSFMYVIIYGTPSDETKKLIVTLCLLFTSAIFAELSFNKKNKRAYQSISWLVFLITIFLAFSEIISSLKQNLFMAISLPLILLVTSWYVYIFARLKTVNVSSEGIQSGNEYHHHYADVILKQKAIFLPWNQIKK